MKQVTIDTDTSNQGIEQRAAEQHVADIMGPAWGDSVQDVETARTMRARQNKPMPNTRKRRKRPAEVDDISIINQQLAAQMDKPPVVTKPSPDIDTNTDRGDLLSSDMTGQTDLEILRVGEDNDRQSDIQGSEDAGGIVSKQLAQPLAKQAHARRVIHVLQYVGGVVVLVSIGLAIFIPTIRASVMNRLGFRASITAIAVDATTLQPLKNVTLSVENSTLATKTASDGRAKLTDVRLGDQTVVLHRLGFADIKRQITFGFRAVDLGEVAMTATGTQVSYIFTDYVSGKPLQGVLVESGESSTKSNKDGKAVLTLAGTPDKISTKLQGYRAEKLVMPSELGAVTKIALVSDIHTVFVSKESGKYDVYKMYLDGKDREVLLAGTGLETARMAVLPSPKGDVVAVASTREDTRNADKYLLTQLTLVDTASGAATTIESAEQITFVGWHGDTIVYQQTVAGTSAGNQNRQKVVAYDTKSDRRFQLVSANQLVGIQLIGNTLYAALSHTDTTLKSSFQKVDLDGTNKKTMYTGTIWALARTGYKTMKLQTPEKWYDYSLGDSDVVESKTSTIPTSLRYYDSSDGRSSLRLDARSGSGALMLWSPDQQAEKTLATMSGLSGSPYWLGSNTVVFWVTNGSSSSQYVVDAGSGMSKKITDTTILTSGTP